MPKYVSMTITLLDDQPNTQKPMTYSQPSSGPAIMQPTEEPPAYTKSGQQTQSVPKPSLNTEELQTRRTREERTRTARREEEMRQTSYNARRNNWPPLPEQCCFQPYFYQDIQVDIPLEFQKIVRTYITSGYSMG
ncbi:hypothetical protein NQ318_003466 [Aromia moschata]|uniref:Secretory carrier-associated membrane protein n=1 Tax=Aromia moschata TaxID=1265417 RepID=A0AAV8YV53_9CUCU|nr:hypothetical protein NQ318_003466 [Aromia moschata]